jgi:hypothetical protein
LETPFLEFLMFRATAWTGSYLGVGVHNSPIGEIGGEVPVLAGTSVGKLEFPQHLITLQCSFFTST